MQQARRRRAKARGTEKGYIRFLLMTENTSNNTIAILQYNLRKKLTRTNSILSDPSLSKYTMLMIQEQYWSEHTKSAPTHGSWTLIESSSYPNRKPCSAIYINNHILDTSAFRIITIPFLDITAVVINTTNNPKPTLIINVYNPPMRTSSRH